MALRYLESSGPVSTVLVAWYPFSPIFPYLHMAEIRAPLPAVVTTAHALLNRTSREISIPNQLSGIADRATESCLSVCSFPLVEFSSHYEKTSYLPIVELPREVDRFRQTLQGRKERTLASEIHFLGNKSSV